MASTDAALFNIAWKTLKARRGETVTYHSGDASVELTAVFTRPNPAQVDGEENFVFASRSWDVLIDPTWPASAPAAFTDLVPSHGDKIVRADGTEFKVQPSDSADLCWRWSEGEHTWRRVFTESV